MYCGAKKLKSSGGGVTVQAQSVWDEVQKDYSWDWASSWSFAGSLVIKLS